MPKLREKDAVILKLKEVVVDYRTRDWCKLPYLNHPYGCPNYGKRKNCPPQAPLFENIVKPPFILVGIKFNLGKHIKKMKKKHPNWSNGQAKCLLFWQKKLDKRLKEICERLASKIPDAKILYNPEANGIHMFETCKKIGLILKRNPQKIVWKIALIGIRKK